MSLDPIVAAIAADVTLNGGRPRISNETLLAHADAIEGAAADARENIATELVALALRLARSGTDAFDDAILQLSMLAAVALGDVARAATLVGDALGSRAAQTLLGMTTSSTPVGHAKTEGAVSPLAARLKNAKTPKKK